MTQQEVIAKLDALERAASDFVRMIQETRLELMETLDIPDVGLLD